tara:strand:- start:75 stop:515 length:441 start_codon:yes stop_codon:yes gene_type:complete
MDKNCSICLSGCKKSNLHKLDCGHFFHSSCIINWFRTGKKSCPVCRSEDMLKKIKYFDWRSRAAHLRKISKRKGAPPELVNIVKRIKKAETKLKKINKEIESQKEIYNKMLKLDRKRYSANETKQRLTRLLGVYSDPKIQVPLIEK